ncbi:MAG TPA: tRNA adenosine(34) deaminase TadA [candidate division Zixibacteria bacterium]|nr:tRNA adenosine(34) deaminase TadA [candidate division Zixibacteria bacterium]
MLVLYLTPMHPDQYEDYMRMAINEAMEAFEADEVPIGSIVVYKNKIVGRGHNQTESLKDATAHAEMIALSAAYNQRGDWRLDDCYLFSTIEPCTMCSGAAVLSRIKTIVFGASDPKFGACGSIFNVPTEKKLNHRIEVVGGILKDEIAEMMQQFFRQVRLEKDKIN